MTDMQFKCEAPPKDLLQVLRSTTEHDLDPHWVKQYLLLRPNHSVIIHGLPATPKNRRAYDEHLARKKVCVPAELLNDLTFMKNFLNAVDAITAGAFYAPEDYCYYLAGNPNGAVRHLEIFGYEPDSCSWAVYFKDISQHLTNQEVMDLLCEYGHEDAVSPPAPLVTPQWALDSYERFVQEKNRWVPPPPPSEWVSEEERQAYYDDLAW